MNDLSSQVKDSRKNAIDIKEKQNNMLKMLTSVSEKQKKCTSNVNVICDKLDIQIKEQKKKFDDMNSEVLKNFNETSVKFDSQLNQLDKKLTTETKNIHDECNTVTTDIVLINDNISIFDIKLAELTKKNDDLSGQIDNLVAVLGEMKQSSQDIDSRCLQETKTLEGSV